MLKIYLSGYPDTANTQLQRRSSPSKQFPNKPDVPERASQSQALHSWSFNLTSLLRQKLFTNALLSTATINLRIYQFYLSTPPSTITLTNYHNASRSPVFPSLPPLSPDPQSPIADPSRFQSHSLYDTTPLPENIPKVKEVGASSAPLLSAAYFIGARCRAYNDDYMQCKTQAYGRGELECMKEGRKVTRCAASV